MSTFDFKGKIMQKFTHSFNQNGKALLTIYLVVEQTQGLI